MFSKKFIITSPRDKEFIAVIRTSVFTYSNLLGLSLDYIEDIKLAVSEACNNIVLHSPSEDTPFYVEFCVVDDYFCVDIIDSLGSFSFSNYTAPDISEINTGGFGIFIIEALTDEFAVDTINGAQVMSLKFKLNGEL